MKRNIKYAVLTTALAALLVFPSCDTSFLDTDPLTEITADAIWQDAGLAQAYMFDIYFTFQDAGFAETMQSSVTDESLFIHNYGQKMSNEAAYNETDLGWFRESERSGHQWGRLYRNIRGCNDFILHIDEATFDEDIKMQLKGEAYFLRAYFMHRLTRGYGGVPIITDLYTMEQTDYTVPRNTYTECIDQIVSDIDQAAELLKDFHFDNTPKGRATYAACLALKVRVLTDAASDLHDQAAASAKSAELANYAQKDLLFYTNGSRQERWTTVKEAAMPLITNGFGHRLAEFTGATVEERATEFQEFFLTDNEETIFARYFIDTKDESGNWPARFNGPCGYHLWGGNVPIQELVDDYSMIDGTAFSWSNPLHTAFPYKNREPRFYASIMYDGMQWRPRPGDYAVYDPYGQIQTGKYQTDPAQTNIDAYWQGMDTRTGRGETWNGTFTGYYLKKFIDPNIDGQTEKAEVPWVFIRYTEIVFDYIEACIELGETGEAVTWLNRIRERAMLPPVTATSQEELRNIYRHERRIEMAFEEQRYWDVRRWMTAPQTPGIIGLHGVNIVATLKPGVPKQAIYKYDEAIYNYKYTRADLSSREARQWKDKGYFLPIHRDEINRNDKLVQNPGY